MNIPNHVAIILDGNGRWAKAKGLPRTAGHVQGAKVVEQICEDAYNMGINYLTVYAFSTENWSRPDSEVATLMNLLRSYMKNSIRRAQKNNMCVRVLGDKSALAEDLRASMWSQIFESAEVRHDETGKLTDELPYPTGRHLCSCSEKRPDAGGGTDGLPALEGYDYNLTGQPEGSTLFSASDMPALSAEGVYTFAGGSGKLPCDFRGSRDGCERLPRQSGSQRQRRT